METGRAVSIQDKGGTEGENRSWELEVRSQKSDFVGWEQIFKFRQRTAPTVDALEVAGRAMPLLVVKNPRARRYLLRLRPDGKARVAIPRGGNLADAMAFANRNAGWLKTQLERLASRPQGPTAWRVGTEIWVRGELVPIRLEEDSQVCFGGERLAVADVDGNLRPAIERHLRRQAATELPKRVEELAMVHGIEVTRVSVRNQRSRWGSCSRRGTIALNWRLIQTPAHVRDYIILHELAHRRHMNHSKAFWQEVERTCPEYLERVMHFDGRGS